MTSIDDLFKKPSLPGNKRKLEVSRDADQVYKASKASPDSSVRTNGRATVEDEEDLDEIAAGPDLPMEEEDEVPDDEDGRFFGGGVTKGTAEVLDFIDEREGDDVALEKFDLAWLRKLALNFEKRISKNAELRARFEDTPQKFMSSEADLDADIKALSILSEHPELYADFSKLGCVSSLVSLLSHENTDIAIDAIEIVNELTDEDVEAGKEQWDALVDGLLEADILSLLYENANRMDESIESDRVGVYHILGVLESLASRPAIALSLGETTKFLPWLLSRIQRKEASVTQNKQYAAEVLAILLQSSAFNRSKIASLEGIDSFLQLLSPYRKRDPAVGSEEEEWLENIFDCITCCVDDGEGKAKFLEAEGIELCLIMVREGKMSKARALRLLDHALGGPDAAACCERLVEAAGLKTIFANSMKKTDNETTEHLLGILSSLLRSLPANEAPRIRLLAKFVEKDYQTINRLSQIREDFASRIAAIDKEISAEKVDASSEESEEKADEWLSRRLDAGLYVLQTVDLILAWLVAEDGGSRTRIIALLEAKNSSLATITVTLQERLDGMNSSGEDEDPVLKDMLATLINYLK